MSPWNIGVTDYPSENTETNTHKNDRPQWIIDILLPSVLLLDQGSLSAAGYMCVEDSLLEIFPRKKKITLSIVKYCTN